MKIAVVGSRTFNDYELLRKTLDTFYPNITQIISGNARGADFLAERYSREEGIGVLLFKPDWKTHGKAAGFIRNRDIVAAADIVVAFWDCCSKGTKNSMEWAYMLNKPLIIIPDFL